MRVIQSTVQRQLTTAETTDDPSDCNVYPYPFADSSAPNFPRPILPHKNMTHVPFPEYFPITQLATRFALAINLLTLPFWRQCTLN